MLGGSYESGAPPNLQGDLTLITFMLIPFTLPLMLKLKLMLTLSLGRFKVNKVKMEYVDDDDLKREEM